MKRIWQWMQENSSALQGIASLVVVITGVIAIVSFLAPVLRPDFVVRVNVDHSTIPPELIRFNKSVSDLFTWDADAFKEIKSQNRRLAELLADPVLKRLDAPSVEFDKARVEVINQSESVVSGLRLRFDGVHSFWGLDISGTFMREDEAEKFEAMLKDGVKGNSVVLPELPAIPPNASIELTLYGDLDLLRPTITTAGRSYSITDVVEVENGFLIEWYLDPFKFVFLLLMCLPILLIIVGFIWNVRRRVVKNETKNIFYNGACELAVDGDPDGAMALLRQAIKAGYSNRQHPLKDDDLESLREREDFIELFKKT